MRVSYRRTHTRKKTLAQLYKQSSRPSLWTSAFRIGKKQKDDVYSLYN
jgi:hypothetical protein